MNFPAEKTDRNTSKLDNVCINSFEVFPLTSARCNLSRMLLMQSATSSWL